MAMLRILSATDQVANHLREELRRGVWTKSMPGGAALARELGVGRMTVENALGLLEKEGLIIPQGAGKRRKIVPLVKNETSSSLRLAILLFYPEDRSVNYMVDLQHLLHAEGHSVAFTSRTQSELGWDLKRISSMVKKTEADAWVVVAGSRDVLEWFAAESLPVFALFGRRIGLPIAGIGPSKLTTSQTAVKFLLSKGHRRIALLAGPTRRLPQPGYTERAFLKTLELAGIRTSSYNLPEWDGKISSLHDCLDSLFRVTPPTALIIQEPGIFFSVQHYLARRGILAPEHISLICTDSDPYFEAQKPSVAHIRWDSKPWIRRIVQWAGKISNGVDDRRQSLSKAEFIDGGTIGPVS